MTYDADAITDFELERLRSKRQRYSERMCSSRSDFRDQDDSGEWYVDELGIDAEDHGTRIAVRRRVLGTRLCHGGEDEDRSTDRARPHGRRRHVGIHEQRLQKRAQLVCSDLKHPKSHQAKLTGLTALDLGRQAAFMGWVARPGCPSIICSSLKPRPASGLFLFVRSSAASGRQQLNATTRGRL